VRPDGIFYIRDDIADPNATDDTTGADVVVDDGTTDVRPDGIFHIRDDVADPNATDEVTGANVFFSLNPTAQPTAK